MNDATMSEERRAPPPPPKSPGTPGATSGAGTADTPREGTPALGDTPREGTPAFDDTPVDGSPSVNDTDEIHIAVEGVAVAQVGPTPDHASEYVPPRALPKPVEHKTMENIPVHISPDADPRRAQTQKAMHVLKREEAQRQLMLMGVDSTPSSAGVRSSTASISDAETGKSRVGLYIGGAIALLVVLALGFIGFNIVAGEPEAAPSARATTAPGSKPAPTSTAAAPAPSPTTHASAAPAPPVSAAPAASADPATKRKKKRRVEEAKPINE